MTGAVRGDGEAADEALMRQVQADDAVAFGVLYDRFAVRAYTVASAIARDRGVADDMVREAFVSLWRSRARYDPGRGTVAGWVITAVRRQAKDVHRAQKVAERDGDAQLRTALGALPAAQREVIGLAYFGELTANEIAAGSRSPSARSRAACGSGSTRSATARPPSQTPPECRRTARR